MWNSIRNWFVSNQDQISWFLIGWLTCAGFEALVQGRYWWALLDFLLAYFNYLTSKIRL